MLGFYPNIGFTDTLNQKTETLPPLEVKSLGGIPDGNILGYKIKGCHSLESYRNICNEKDIGKVLAVANKMDKPNFNKTQKLITLKYLSERVEFDYQRDEEYSIKNEIADIFVVDEERKTMFVSPMFATNSLYPKKKAPNVYATINSNWFCVRDNGAGFRFVIPSFFWEDTDEYDMPDLYHATASDVYEDETMNKWACQGFVDDKFISYDHEVPRQFNSYFWLNKNGQNNERFSK